MKNRSIIVYIIIVFMMLNLNSIQVWAQQEDINLPVYNNQTEITAPGSITLKDGFYIPAGKAVWIHTTGRTFKNCLPLSSVPSASQNYILTTIFKEAGLVPGTAGYTTCQANQVVQYFDGLGRPAQNIVIQGSPTGKDIIMPIAYDAFGRESIKYQPYAQATNGGGYRPSALSEQAGFYGAPPAGVTATPNPYAVTVFELSPLNRVTEQGATGAAWQPQVNSISGHTVKIEYSTNTTDEVKLWKINAAGTGATATVYQPGTLSKTIQKDENWKAENGKAGISEGFKDSRGRLVLKRVWETDAKSLSTYYVYDDLGNLSYVLPPAVNENGLKLSSFTEGDANFENYMYGYHYDGRKRLIEKKVPGQGWVFMVYNKLDQLVLSQDANQRSKSTKEWLFAKYDVLGRVVVTGLYNDNSSRDALQSTLNSQSTLWESRAATDIGYSNASFPQIIAYYHCLNYYDDYDFAGNKFVGPTGNQATSGRTRGLLTGTKLTTLGTDNKLLTVHYYDEEGRVVQSKAENHLGGAEVVDNTYNFAGELTASTHTHTSSVPGTTTIANTYLYDHVGRKLATKEIINGQPEVVLSKWEYNELGQLLNKNLHSTDGGNSFLQNTNYAYNERGWLKNITSGQFSMQLKYSDGSTPQYNGNIANQLWGASSNATANTFSYSYDKLNRLTSAVTPNLGEAIAYDEMSNIKTLTRDGFGTNNYTGYTGNKLTQISGFTNSTYGYDANGNLINDSQKNINVSYNYLNLPQNITGSQNLSYLYDASGKKLKKTSGIASVTDYVDGIQYTNGKIDFIQTEEGVARNNSGTYSYEYTLNDHLGNNRTTFYQNPNTKQLEVLQRDDYYAFGLRKSTLAASNENKYLYNGKELQQELGQYDYGFRFYDPVIGRFNTIDPMAENHYDTGPYHYVLNNPLRYMDHLGLDTTYKQKDMKGGDWHNYKPGSDDIGLNEVTITSPRYNGAWGGFGDPWAGFDDPWAGLGDPWGGFGNFIMIPPLPPPVLTSSSSGPFTQSDNRGSLGSERGFWNGFSDSKERSNFRATSTFIGEAALLEGGTESLLRLTLRGASTWADKAYVLNSIKGAARTGAVIGAVGIVATIYEDFRRQQGITWGTGAKALILGTGVAFPVFGLIYGVADLSTGLITGKTLTDRIGDGLDSAVGH